MSFKDKGFYYVLPICELTRLIMEDVNSSDILFIQRLLGYTLTWSNIKIGLNLHLVRELLSSKLWAPKAWMYDLNDVYTRVWAETYCYEFCGRVSTYFVQVWCYMGYNG